jgi:hypothetical protein
MKKILFSSLLILLSFSFTTNAQEYQNALKLNPLSLIASTGNIAYERSLSETSSLQIGVFYTGYKLSGMTYSGFGITPEYRKYLTGEALNGLYLAPFLRYQSLTLKDSYDDIFTGTTIEEKATLSTIGGGLLIGRQWCFGAFTLDIFGGPQYNSGTVTYDATYTNTFEISGAFNGFSPRFGTTIGFAF